MIDRDIFQCELLCCIETLNWKKCKTFHRFTDLSDLLKVTANCFKVEANWLPALRQYYFQHAVTLNPYNLGSIFFGYLISKKWMKYQKDSNILIIKYV